MNLKQNLHKLCFACVQFRTRSGARPSKRGFGFLMLLFTFVESGTPAALPVPKNRIDFAYHGFAIINALALAKVMLTAKDLHLGEQLDDAPLIYPTVLKSALFSVVLACFTILEEAAIGLYHHQSFQQSITDLGRGTLNAILTLTLLLFVVLILFVGLGELQRVLGAGTLRQIFLHPRPPLPA